MFIMQQNERARQIIINQKERKIFSAPLYVVSTGKTVQNDILYDKIAKKQKMWCKWQCLVGVSFVRSLTYTHSNFIKGQ